MDEGFLLRIMRLLAVNNIFREVEEKVFAHTTLSAGMADDLVSAHLGGLLYDVYKACTSLSDALKGGYPNAWVARFGVPMYESTLRRVLALIGSDWQSRWLSAT